MERPPRSIDREVTVLKELREFIDRGDVLDLAVAVVIAGAFGAVVTSFTDDVLLQLVAAVVGEPDFSGLTADVGDSTIRYGSFLTALVSFLIISTAVFAVVKAVNAAKRRFEKPAAPEAPAGPTELDVLLEIKALLAQRG